MQMNCTGVYMVLFLLGRKDQKKKSQKEVVFDRSLGKLTFIWAEKVFSGQENNKSKDLQT